MIKRFTVLCILSIVVFQLEGQTYAPEVWHYGQIITVKGDTVRGKIKYSFIDDLVQLRNPRTRKVYNAQNIVNVSFTDSISDELREIKPFNFETAQNFTAPLLFAIADTIGKYTLLYREYVSEYSSYSPNTGFLTYHKDLERAFFYKKGNKVTFLKSRRSAIYKLFADRKVEMKTFIQTNRLNVGRLEDLVKIFRYYNTL